MSARPVIDWNECHKVTPPSDWTPVGSEADPGRLRHHCRIRPFLVPGAGGRLRPFLSLQSVVAPLRSGAYLLRQRANPTRLRIPDSFVFDEAEATAPLRALNLAEAAALTDLVGGRLPTEKEADHLLFGAGLPPIDLDRPISLWTASGWDRFAYSLSWYDAADGLWKEKEPISVPRNAEQTVLHVDPNHGIITREPASAKDGRHAALVVRTA